MAEWRRCSALVGDVSEDSRAFAKEIDGQLHIVVNGVEGFIDFCFVPGVKLADESKEVIDMLKTEAISCSNDYMLIAPIVMSDTRETVAVSIDDMQFCNHNGESFDCIDYINEDVDTDDDEYVELLIVF